MSGTFTPFFGNPQTNNKNAFSNIEGYNWFLQYDYTFQSTIEYLSGINNVTFDGDFDYAYDYNENGYQEI